jgi:hypothetical protein
MLSRNQLSITAGVAGSTTVRARRFIPREYALAALIAGLVLFAVVLLWARSSRRRCQRVETQA